MDDTISSRARAKYQRGKAKARNLATRATVKQRLPSPRLFCTRGMLIIAISAALRNPGTGYINEARRAASKYHDKLAVMAAQ